MKLRFKSLLLAATLAAIGPSVLAQGMAPADGMRHEGMMGPGGARQDGAMDPAKMQAMVERRHAALKAKLKITPDQEAAWTTFSNVMKPAPEAMKRHLQARAELDKLTTPERIDKMRALRAERNAEMDKRADAAKAFYAVLTPYQKGVFDAHTAKAYQGGRRHGRPQH